MCSIPKSVYKRIDPENLTQLLDVKVDVIYYSPDGQTTEKTINLNIKFEKYGVFSTSI